MSRSNPMDNTPHPCVRWFEWNGEAGNVRFYDKDAKKTETVALPFTFILLDELASVRGWHEASQSGISSNEVRDTSQDVLVVKSFKGGILAEGLYRDIKDRVAREGGHYSANCYIAFKHHGELAIGSIRFKGAALGAWMDFRKAHRADLYTKAITIGDVSEGRKGRVVFKTPIFGVSMLSEASNNVAKGLDVQLQAWLDGYLRRNKRDAAEHAAQAPVAPSPHQANAEEFDSDREPALVGADAPRGAADLMDDDIPF